MIVGPHVSPPWPVFTPAPVANHPDNEALEAWWLVVPGLDGGRKWYDIAGTRHGTLANMGAASGWRGSSHPGGWGCLRSSAGSEIVQAPAAGLPTAPAASWTISFWHRTRTFISLAQAFGFGADPARVAVGDGRYTLQFDNNYYFWGGNADWDTLVPFDVDNTWHHVTWTSDGTSLRLYRDGVPAAGPQAIPYAATAGSQVTAFGRHPSAASSPNMDIDDGRVLSRALPAAQVRDSFNRSRRGYPGLLNRWRPSPATFDLGAATTAVAISARGSWDARSVAAEVGAGSWDDRLRIGMPRSGSFDVRTVAATTRAARGDVRTRAGRTGATTWDARTTGGRSGAISWDARARATSSRLAAWDLRVPLGLARSSAWDDRTALSLSRPQSWDVRSRAVLARPSWWDIASAILTAGRAAAAGWDVRAAVARLSPAAWDTRAAVSGTATVRWDVRSTAGRSGSVQWAVRTLATVSGGAAWDLASTVLVVGRSGSTAWDVLLVAGLPGQGSWDSRAHSGQLSRVIWDVRTRAARTGLVPWDVRILGSSSGSAAWDIASTVLVADVLGRAGWDILAATGRSGTTPWDVRVPASRAGSTGWDVRTLLDLGGPASWDALAHAGLTAGSAWDVSAFVMTVSRTGAAAWDVLGAVDLTGILLWDVSATPFVDLRRGILNHLRGNAALTAIVGTRIYRGWLPQGAKRPAVTVSVVSNTPGRGLDGPTRIADARIQIDAWADRSDDRVALVAVLAREGFLHGVRSRWIGGVFIRWCYQDSEADLDEPAGAGGEGTIYRTPIDFLLSYRT